MSKTCKILLIRCMDYRLNSQMLKWIKKSVLFEGKAFDLISLDGAVKDLVSDDLRISENIFRQIKDSIELHGVEEVIIFSHSDCRAYIKNNKFLSPEAEKKKQFEDMREAKKMIHKKYREIEIYLVWGQLKDKKGESIEFEIV